MRLHGIAKYFTFVVIGRNKVKYRAYGLVLIGLVDSDIYSPDNWLDLFWSNISKKQSDFAINFNFYTNLVLDVKCGTGCNSGIGNMYCAACIPIGCSFFTTSNKCRWIHENRREKWTKKRLPNVWDSRTASFKSYHIPKLSNMRNNQIFDMMR